MSEALSLIYYVYDKFIEFIFNDMELFTGVKFGWILITVFVFGILITNIIRIPKAAGTVRLRSKKDE